MVQQRSKTTRSLAVSENGSVGGSSKDSDQVYCVVLHVAEAINFMGREASEQRDQILMNAALNTVDFDVEGCHSAANEAVVFNSNCIWECDLAGIKRIKTDHRPVKLTFSACRGSGKLERKTIGNLLLPLRGLPVLGTTGSHNGAHLKMIWHKLICISSEFRSQKPEVLLVLAIIKKSILHTKDFDHIMQFSDQKAPPTPPLKSPGHSITASMLQSQANIYVQSLVQLGLLQVGNDPLVDCDIIEVVLQLKQLRKVNRLVKWLNQGKDPSSVVVMFDFVGNVTNIELKLNDSDSYAVNDVLGLRFKTSLRSMRMYFQRIFYLPFNMYMNGTAIANYRMDFNNLLPPDSHFANQLEYSTNGSFLFNRIGRQDSARDPKPPLMEYTFTVEIKNKHLPQEQVEPEPAPSTSSGVIRELPTNRQDTDAISLSHGQHDFTSVGSLNVGAELSISGESRGSFSIQEDEFNFDTSQDISRMQNKRRKFTRLTGEEPNLESEEESCMDKKFSKQEGQKCDLNSSEDMLVARASRSSKLQSASEEPLLPKTLKVKAKVSKLSVKESSQPRLMASKNVKPPLEQNEYDNRSEVTSLQQFELEERILAEEEKLESANRTRIKSGQSTKYAKLQVEEDEFSEATSLQQFEPEEKRLAEESNRMQRTKKVSKGPKAMELHESSSGEGIPETKVRKKYVKKVSQTKLKEEIGLPQASPVTCISQETFDMPEERMDNDHFPSEEIPSTKNKLCKKAKTIKIVKKQANVESVELADHKVQCKRKVKSKTVMHEDLTDISMSTQDGLGIAKPDLALRARWVEVNKVQSAALEETELFLEETCQNELHEILYEDQLALGLARPPSPKNKLRTDLETEVMSQSQGNRLKKKKRILPTSEHLLHEEFKSSEECITLPEATLRSEEVIIPETKRQVRVLKKKKPKQTIVEEEPSVELNDSLEEPAVKPIKRKVIRKKSSVIIKNNELLENVEPEQEIVTVQKKKIIKRSKPVTDMPSEDDVKVTKKVSSRSSVKSIKSRKATMDLPSLDDFDMDHSADTETVGQRIRSWRRQQIERFEEELARKEEHYKAQLEQMEYQELKILQPNHKDPAEDDIQADNSVDYQAKFNELEQHILQLKAEMEQQVMLFESRSWELRQENLQLANEKLELKARIVNMEEQLTQLRTQGSEEADLKEVIGELRSQNNRYLNVARLKDRYKKQWRRCARRVNALKLAMYEKSAESQMEASTINLREILTKDALAFEQEYGEFRCGGTSENVPFTPPEDAPDVSFISTSQTLSQSIAETISKSIFQSSFESDSQLGSQFSSQSGSQSSSQFGSQTIPQND
ncbi:hypothetical protein KR059_007572 [Drosophila kikkawai]|nr:hypothetical protein KR059_007572 [Drosophila kikkawai]